MISLSCGSYEVVKISGLSRLLLTYSSAQSAMEVRPKLACLVHTELTASQRPVSSHHEQPADTHDEQKPYSLQSKSPLLVPFVFPVNVDVQISSDDDRCGSIA
eukprot:1097221_1